MKKLARFCAIAALFLSAPVHLLAATYTWTGAGFMGNQDFLWSNPFNWSGLSAPATGETGVQLVFPNTGAPRNTTNDVSNLGISSISFFGANYVINGRTNGTTLTLVNASAGGFAVAASANNCQFAATTFIHLGSTGSIAVALGNTLYINSRISGTFGFSKLSAGALRLQNSVANTFTGTTRVEDGPLDLNAAALALPGAVIIGGTNMSQAPLLRLFQDDQIGDTSPVTVNPNGRFWLNTHDDTIGALTIMNGSVTTGLNGLNSSPGLLLLGGNITNLHHSGASTYGTINGRLSLGNNNRIFHCAPVSQLLINANIGGSIIFNPGFTVTGGGLLKLSGTNNYGGVTTIEAGAIELSGNTQMLGNTNAGTVVESNAQLILDGANVGQEPLTINGVTNGLTQFFFYQTNSWAGPIVLNGESRVRGISFPGVDAELDISGAISGTGAMRKTGSGTLRFTGFGNNTFSGGFYGQEGLTYFAKSASASALGGPLFIGRTNVSWPADHVIVETHNQIPNQLTVTVLNSGSLTIHDGVTGALGNIVFEGGALFGSPATTLTGNITNRVGIDDAQIYGGAGLSAVPHTIHSDDGSRLEVYGVLGGSGGFAKTGSGSLVFHNTNTYSGLTTVKSGWLVLHPGSRPGSTAAGTTVEGNAAVYLVGASITNEVLTMQTASPGGIPPILITQSDSVWDGNIVLNATSSVIIPLSPSELTLRGKISGTGGLSYQGDYYDEVDNGTLVLTGSEDNTFTGPTTVTEGTLVLRKENSAQAIAGPLIIGTATSNSESALVICEDDSQFNQPLDGTVTVHHNGTFDCNGYVQTLSNLILHDGWADAVGTHLNLLGDITVQPGANGSSYLLGGVALSQGTSSTHTLDVQSNAVFWNFGDISEGVGVQHLTKSGTGHLQMLGSNSFRGAFTIESGTVNAGGARPFGTTNGATIIYSGATLAPLSMTNAERFQLTGNGFTNAGVLRITGTNVFTGAITLSGDSTVVCENDAILTLGGSVGGIGAFIKEGAGTLRFSGTNSNTFVGATVVNKGALELIKTNAIAVPGSLAVNGVGPGNGVRLFQPQQIADNSAVAINGTGSLYLNNFDETIGSLTGNGTIFQNNAQTGRLTVGANGTTMTFSGGINGGGGLTKFGAGTLILSANNSYSGSTIVSNGTLVVNGQQPQSAVTVLNGGTLGGIGRVGALSAANGSHVSPGASPGALSCGPFNLNSSSATLHIEINGSEPGTGYDQIKATGNVSFMGGLLALSMNTAGAVSNQYIIVDNDGVDLVGGTFTGLANGASITNNGIVFVVKYNGGDGNDVVLIQQNVTGGPQIGGIQPNGSGGMKISGLGLPNTLYNVEATESLNAPIAWKVLDNVLSDGSGLLNFLDAEAGNFAMRFYRFVIP